MPLLRTMVALAELAFAASNAVGFEAPLETILNLPPSPSYVASPGTEQLLDGLLNWCSKPGLTAAQTPLSTTFADWHF